MSTKFRGYQGIFFDAKTAKLLEKLQVNSLAYTVQDMHVTFNFGYLERYPEKEMGKDIEVQLVGYASDGKNSGFEVALPKDLETRFYKGNRPIHVTVSLGVVNGEKGKAVDTAKLEFEPLRKPMTITGRLGYFIFSHSEGKKMDNSIWSE